MDEEEILRTKLEMQKQSHKMELAKTESNYIFIGVWILLGSFLTMAADWHPALGFGCAAAVGYFAGKKISEKMHGVKLDR